MEEQEKNAELVVIDKVEHSRKQWRQVAIVALIGFAGSFYLYADAAREIKSLQNSTLDANMRCEHNRDTQKRETEKRFAVQQAAYEAQIHQLFDAARKQKAKKSAKTTEAHTTGYSATGLTIIRDEDQKRFLATGSYKRYPEPVWITDPNQGDRWGCPDFWTRMQNAQWRYVCRPSVEDRYNLTGAEEDYQPPQPHLPPDCKLWKKAKYGDDLGAVTCADWGISATVTLKSITHADGTVTCIADVNGCVDEKKKPQ